MPFHIDTPLLESNALSASVRRPVWIKLDALQPTGSFKLRGVGHACETHYARGARRFVSSSGGNAGLAVAYMGRKLSAAVTVVVPETTSERAKDLLRLEGAEVIVHGASWQEANQRALALLGGGDAFIHPFDDPLLWEGHATVIDEVVLASLRPAVVLVSVGGGGLLCGVAEGLRRNGLTSTPIIAVETRGADSFRAAIDAGERVELERITSIATTLGAKRVCERAFRWTNEHAIRSIVVPDRSALDACERFLADHRILVEPACGASLAPVYENAAELQGEGDVLVIVCGGVTATLDQIREWSKR